MNAVQLLPAVRDLYSRQPEAFYLEPWELASFLWSIGYTDELEDEVEEDYRRGLGEHISRMVADGAPEGVPRRDLLLESIVRANLAKEDDK